MDTMGNHQPAGAAPVASALDRLPDFANPAAPRGTGDTELLLKAHTELAENAQHGTLDELIKVALAKAESLTHSSLGFFHFVDAEQDPHAFQAWSANTIKNLRHTDGKHPYPVTKDGAWTDCLRTGAPAIRNHSPSSSQRKSPATTLLRELAVPVMRGGVAVALLSVGNKNTEYTASDAALVAKIANMVVDYALRKRAEEALRGSEARLSAAQRIARIGSWEWDVVADIAAWSDETFRLFGIPREPLTEYHQKFFEWLDPADHLRVEQALQDALQGLSLYNIEYRIASPDGGKKFIHAQAEVLRDQAGKPILMRGTMQDITARRALEDQLRQAQKLESVGQLAGGFAHDFNNLLSATMMNLGLLQDNPHLDESAREIIKDLGEQAKRAATLTRQLLMFSRRAVLDVKLLDLNELVANLLKMLGRLIGENIVIQFNGTPNLPSLEADAGMLEQVIVNLAVNARDAMPKGGRLVIRLEAIQADAQRVKGHPQARPGQFLCLSIADTGCGMDEATLHRLFEPFFTTKPAGKGTGLGLATVHGIIAQHKGWVEVQSELGQGSTFRVYLPAAPADATLIIASPEEMPLLQGTETILLVEDDTGVRRLVARGLRRMGYTVVEAANGTEAVKRWHECAAQIDLLFTDIVMPGPLSGLELAEQLRVEKPGLKVIVSSGYNAEIPGQTVPLPPTLTHFQKPYHLGQLSLVVRRCLDSGPKQPAR